MSALYGLAREAFLGGDIQWDADDIRCILVDEGQYTVSIDTHQFLTSIPSGARVAVSTQLLSPTVTLGVADAADMPLTGVTGVTTEAVVIYVHTGVDATAKLIAYIDNAGVVLTPNGGDVTIQWDNGANKIFKL
jgi:hypothetical protein